MSNLNANTITLQGRHIIEASAGTGKTFNITKLYIRLLLERRILPSNILVMTFTKDATQEIIGRVEGEIRDVLDKISSGKEVKVSIKRKETLIHKGDDNYKHLKRALLEIDEAAIFTIHGFCKKVLSEQAFASGMEMDVSMEVDTSDVLQKVVEDFFRKHINRSETNFGFLKLYNLHTPEKFLDKLKNVIRADYEILVKQAISLDEFRILKKQQLELFVANQSVVDAFLSGLGKDEPQGKRVEEYHRALEWLKLDNETSFPDDISIITDGRKIRAKQINPVFIGLKELRDLQTEIGLANAAQFIKQSCLKIRQDFVRAKEQKGVLDFDDLITKLCKSVKKSPDLVKTLQAQYPVALIDEFQDTDAQQYEILDTIFPLKNVSHSGLDPESLQHDSHSHAGGNLMTNGLDSKDTRLRGYDGGSMLPNNNSHSGLDPESPKNDESSEILKQVQDDGNRLLLMIGDPKQAIYGFRGGDIFTYLKAKESCLESNRWSMDTNWRSTREMIKAYNRLFYTEDYNPEDETKVGERIFNDKIGYQIVKASPKADDKIKDFGDNLKPINYFYYPVEQEDKKGDIDTQLSSWTANEISRLLASGNVKESDIAILVENRTQASSIQQALAKNNLSSVYLSQRDNVYHSQEADEILAVMEGINELENKSLLKKALATSLLGGTNEKFVSYTDEIDVSAWDNEIENAKALRQQWQKYGFMSFIMSILHHRFTQRSQSKERTVTNILHLAELIKVAENKYKHPNQLIKWYRQQIKTSGSAEGELRLESDDNLIKIITIHGSKGLEYSAVFIPFACYASPKKFESSNFSKYYDEDLKQTVYKIGKDDSVKQQIEKEIIEELMRLFYVAVTRAEHRCYIGIAKYQERNSDTSFRSPLAQFLGYKKNDSWLEKVQKITDNPVNQSMLIDISNDTKLPHSPLEYFDAAQQPSADRRGVAKIFKGHSGLDPESHSQNQEILNQVQDDSSNLLTNQTYSEESHSCVGGNLIANEISCDNLQSLKSKTITLKNDNWEMLSFSKISKSKAQNIALEKENDESEDESIQEAKQDLEYRFTAPKGADLGNILHNVLEHTDFRVGHIDDALLQEQMDRYKVVAADDFDNLKEWLEECLVAPIRLISHYKKQSCHSREGGNLLAYGLDLKDTRLRGYDDGGVEPNNKSHSGYWIQSSTGFDPESPSRNQEILNQVQDDCSVGIKYDKNCLQSVKLNSDDNNSFTLKAIPNSKTLKEAEFYFPIKNEYLYKTNILKVLEEYRESTKLKDYSHSGLTSTQLSISDPESLQYDSHSHAGRNLLTNGLDSKDTRLRGYDGEDVISAQQPIQGDSNIYENLSNQKIFGMLHGFIDLIFEYDGKYYVADYKSNYLGDKLENYNQLAMQQKNQSSFYDLQYLIYSVALTKYLEQNIPNYDYEKHFGGVYYFYLRGMKNGYGVYSARPKLEIISKLSSIFDGGKGNV